MDQLFTNAVNTIKFSLKQENYQIPDSLIISTLKDNIKNGYVLSKAIEKTREDLLYDLLLEEQDLESESESESESEELENENIEGLDFQKQLEQLKENVKKGYNKLKNKLSKQKQKS